MKSTEFFWFNRLNQSQNDHVKLVKKSLVYLTREKMYFTSYMHFIMLLPMTLSEWLDINLLLKRDPLFLSLHCQTRVSILMIENLLILKPQTRIFSQIIGIPLDLQRLTGIYVDKIQNIMSIGVKTINLHIR